MFWGLVRFSLCGSIFAKISGVVSVCGAFAYWYRFIYKQCEPTKIYVYVYGEKRGIDKRACDYGADREVVFLWLMVDQLLLLVPFPKGVK